ncbi:DUF167 domain-containing protein [Ktedonobacteria bacterium brp13]|nr:DUF167 domain-containing protein [Ktedonobacteria bacterium brp13]
MLISVRVIPRSAHNKLEWIHEDDQEAGKTGTQVSLRARLTAPPVDGAANDALVKLLSMQLGLPKRGITIIRGATSRQKVLEIADLTSEDLWRRLQKV